MDLFLLRHKGGGGGGGEKGLWGGKRKWYENVNSALFMDPVEEYGGWLVDVSQPSHACLHLCTYTLMTALIK